MQIQAMHAPVTPHRWASWTSIVCGYGVRKRRSRFRSNLFLFVLLTAGCFYKFYFQLKLSNDTHRHFNTSLLIKSNSSVKQYPACPIPQLDPYDKSIQHFLSEKAKPPYVDCEKNYTFLFNSTRDSTIFPAKGNDYFRQEGIGSCHYRTVARSVRRSWPDLHVNISLKSYPLSLTKPTIIRSGHEFIAIYCKWNGSTEEKLVDVHAFVPLKAPKYQYTHDSNNPEGKRKWNVLIFGLDAVSRMNFLRTMPKTFAFLKNELGAVEMVGYNKVGDNTFPNIMPMLTSKKPSELSCFTESPRIVNDCPLIWKEFSKQGYYTSFAEDNNGGAIFNYVSYGFKKQPTDYYTRAIMRLADTKLASNFIWTMSVCYGPRLTFKILLDYMEKFVYRMSESGSPFFQFIWATALTHDHLAAGLLGDQHLLQSLKWLKGSGHLDKTVFILMSDHGNRMEWIQNSVQGSLEGRLPLLYLVVPDAFKQQYKLAYQNLLSNSDKLVTTFDIHETLQDILHLENIEDSFLAKERSLFQNLRETVFPLRGISLFRPVPEYRTCEMAGVENQFCSCNELTPVSSDEPVLKDVTITAVNLTNSILAGSSRCAKLQLDRVTFALRAGRLEHYLEAEAYLIKYQTMPGSGRFEALVIRREKVDPWKVEGVVVRTNVYGNQSRCVDDAKLKPYCYCS